MIDFTELEKDIEYRTLSRYGGQHAGVDSTVVVIHKPTGLAVVSDTERSQLSNKAKATTQLVDYLSRLGLVKCSCT